MHRYKGAHSLLQVPDCHLQGLISRRLSDLADLGFLLSSRPVEFIESHPQRLVVGYHDLRHSFASFLVSGGRSLYEVQQILGHSDPKITIRYAHLSSEASREAANVAAVLAPRLAA